LDAIKSSHLRPSAWRQELGRIVAAVEKRHTGRFLQGRLGELLKLKSRAARNGR
jgi:hypothetical protein